MSTVGAPQGIPVQILQPHVSSEDGTESITVNEDSLNVITENLASSGAAAVSLIGVMGPYRTGKSFLLNLMLRYLTRRESEAELAEVIGGSPKKSISAEPEWRLGDSGALPDWVLEGNAERVEGDTNFAWQPGKDLCTQGVWIWSKPFTFTDPGGRRIAVMLMDTQGTTMSNAATFVMVTRLCSKLILNMNRSIQDDRIDMLDYVTTLAQAIMRQESLLDSQAENNSTPSFGHLELLLRDWPNYDDDFSLAQCKDQVLDHMLDHLSVERVPEDQKECAERLAGLFRSISATGLPHPGLPVTKPTYRGEIAKIQTDFLHLLDEFMESFFASDCMHPVRPLGNEISPSNFKQVVSDLAAAVNKSAGHLAVELCGGLAEVQGQQPARKSARRSSNMARTLRSLEDGLWAQSSPDSEVPDAEAAVAAPAELPAKAKKSVRMSTTLETLEYSVGAPVNLDQAQDIDVTAAAVPATDGERMSTGTASTGDADERRSTRMSSTLNALEQGLWASSNADGEPSSMRASMDADAVASDADGGSRRSTRMSTTVHTLENGLWAPSPEQPEPTAETGERDVDSSRRSTRMSTTVHTLENGLWAPENNEPARSSQLASSDVAAAPPAVLESDRRGSMSTTVHTLENGLFSPMSADPARKTERVSINVGAEAAAPIGQSGKRSSLRQEVDANFQFTAYTAEGFVETMQILFPNVNAYEEPSVTVIDQQGNALQDDERQDDLKYPVRVKVRAKTKQSTLDSGTSRRSTRMSTTLDTLEEGIWASSNPNGVPTSNPDADATIAAGAASFSRETSQRKSTRMSTTLGSLETGLWAPASSSDSAPASKINAHDGDRRDSAYLDDTNASRKSTRMSTTLQTLLTGLWAPRMSAELGVEEATPAANSDRRSTRMSTTLQNLEGGLWAPKETDGEIPASVDRGRKSTRMSTTLQTLEDGLWAPARGRSSSSQQEPDIDMEFTAASLDGFLEKMEVLFPSVNTYEEPCVTVTDAEGTIRHEDEGPENFVYPIRARVRARAKKLSMDQGDGNVSESILADLTQGVQLGAKVLYTFRANPKDSSAVTVPKGSAVHVRSVSPHGKWVKIEMIDGTLGEVPIVCLGGAKGIQRWQDLTST